MPDNKNGGAIELTPYTQVVNQFAITLRRDREKFSDQFTREVERFPQARDEVWIEVMRRAKGRPAKQWIDSFQDKAKLVVALRNS